MNVDSISHFGHYVERRQAQTQLLRALNIEGAGVQTSHGGGGVTAATTKAMAPMLRPPRPPKGAVAITNLSNLWLQGRGGVGKTVLAKWAVEQPVVKDRYPLRFWVQLSQDPDMLHCLRNLFLEVTRTLILTTNPIC